jgi:hypothetical protein
MSLGVVVEALLVVAALRLKAIGGDVSRHPRDLRPRTGPAAGDERRG